LDFYSKDDIRSKEEYLKDFENFLVENDASSIAAMLIEPMIGSAGGFFMKENVLVEMIQILKSFGIKSILDEVISGFWRLGHEFAHQLYGISPDAVIVSKALTNGMWPMAAVIINSAEIVNYPGFGFTTSAHPAGCSAALAAIKLLDKVGPTVVDLGESIERAISYNLHPQIRMERVGAFFGLHLFDDTMRRFSKDENIGAQVAKAAFDNEVIIRGNPSSVIMAPAFVINSGPFGGGLLTCMVKKAIDQVLTSKNEFKQTNIQ
jgi:beta-alanine--pyruvate transaminase